MRFRILGPLEVWDGRGWVGVPPGKQRALLAVLLLTANQLVPADGLIEQLWPRQPPTGAANQLQVYISRLRRRLDDRPGLVLVTQSPGYRLVVGAGELDLQRFEELTATGRRAVQEGALETAAGSLGEALELWRGRALADVPPGPLVDGEAARLEERRLLAEEDRIDVELRRGRHGGLVGQLQALVAQQPLRERLWGQLLLALYRSGRQAEALAAYQQLRGSLVRELGIEPCAELQLAASQGGAVVICAIDGAGGIGKSALAIHAAHRLAPQFPDGQLYVNLQGATPGLAPLAPIQALGRLLRTLGLEPAAIPGDVQEASSRFRSLAAGRRLLVVLDNARDAAQVRWLLPASPICAVLVTSRRVLATLDGARHLHLDVLPTAEAVELLGRLVGVERVAAEPDAADRLVQLCDRLPLAVRIAGARLAARPAWPLAALAGRLADAQQRLDELDAGELVVRACFQVSHQLLAGSPDAVDQQAARAFGLLGLPDTPDFGVAMAARLLDQPQDVAEAALERLVDAQLLQTPTPGRYRFHDLLRLYAREQAQAGEDEPARQAALKRALGWYLTGAERADEFLMPAGLYGDDPGDGPGAVLADRQAALAWLEAERANLVAAAGQAAGHPTASIARVAWQLNDALWRFFELRSHWADWQAVCQAALQAAERAGDLPATARALEHLGVVHGQQRHYQDAISCLERSLAICRQVGDRSTEGRALNNLGQVYQEQGRYQDALGFAEQSLALRRAVGDRHGEGKVLNNLGEIYRKQGRDQEAVGCYEQALAICRRVGDRLAEAGALRGLGHAVAATLGPQAARAHWTAALGILEDLGAPQADDVRRLLADSGAGEPAWVVLA